MRIFLRSLVFSYISIFITQHLIGGLLFTGNIIQTMFVVTLGLGLLNMFMPPILKIISLPTKGVTYIFLSFILVLITLYVFTLFIPGFYIQETTISKLIILGVVLPSKHLTAIWSVVFTSLVFTVFYSFFMWLCKGKK